MTDGPRREPGIEARLPLKPAAPEPSTRFANLSLGLDALLCNAAGLVLTLTGAFMSDWLGVAGWIITLFGVIVLFWSFVVTLFANRKLAKKREVLFVMRANIVFVVIAVVVAFAATSMTQAGQTATLLAAGITGAFAVAQFLAARGL